MTLWKTRKRHDAYPTRLAGQNGHLAREEPVVYSTNFDAAPIPKDDILRFEEDGFVVLENVFSPSEVEGLQAHAAGLCSGQIDVDPVLAVREPGNDAVRSVFKIHEIDGPFSRLARDVRLLRLAELLLGDDVYIHQSRLNYKPGFDGKEFYWHSDFETWHSEDGMPRMRALSMSVLLTPNTEANSPTMFMRGSHKTFVPCVGATPEEYYKESLKQQTYGTPDKDSLAELAQSGIAMPKGKAGSVVVFDCNIMHGSNSNIAPHPRANAFFVYNAVSNRLESPYGGTEPRPEFLAARKSVSALTAIDSPLDSAA